MSRSTQPAVFVLVGLSVLLGIASLAPKASKGLVASFGVLLIVVMFSFPLVAFAAALA